MSLTQRQELMAPMMSRVKILRFCEPMKDAGVCIGKALERDRHLWPWQSNDACREELMAGHKAFEAALNALDDYVEQQVRAAYERGIESTR